MPQTSGENDRRIKPGSGQSTSDKLTPEQEPDRADTGPINEPGSGSNDGRDPSTRDNLGRA